MLNDQYRACQAGIKAQVVEMAINGSDTRNTARVLIINKNTIISTLKKANTLVQIHPKLTELSTNGELEVRLEATCEAEIDEQGSFLCEE